MKMYKTLLVSLALALAVGTAHGAVLLGWEYNDGVDGSGAGKHWDTSSNDVNLSPASWTAGPGINSDDASRWGSDRFRFFRPNDGTTPLGSGTSALAFSEGDYFEFTIDPDSGYQYSVDSLNVFGSIGNGRVHLELRSSEDSYGSILDELEVGDGTSQTRTWTLPGTAHDDLTSAVTFRLYGYSVASTGHTINIDDQTGDDVWVEGTVIPEPASVALFTLLGGTMIAARRRRRA